MARTSEGLTHDLRVRATPDEAQMAADIAAHLGTSGNRAVRWAIRLAWQHATSTTDHQHCPTNSPCANATRGLSAPAGRHRTPVQDGQTVITHEATVEKKSS